MTNIKLNGYIFSTSVAVHLMNFYISDSESFSSLLEYSLLSKQCFKIFQNLIIFNKFIFPLYNFLKYIKSNNDNNNNNNNFNIDTYKYQLIQFKHIEIIMLSNYDSKTSLLNGDIMYNKKRKRNEQDDSKGGGGGDGSDGDGSDDEDENEYQHKNGSNEHATLKRMFNIYCPNLKKVCILHRERAKFRSNFDETCDGFFKFKKLYSFWACDFSPCSFRENNNDGHYPREFEYSFKFISNYKPNKIYISTRGDTPLHLKTMNNLLNFKSIKSIEFIDHITPLSLITSIFQSSNNCDNKNLVSLHLKINENEEELLKCLAASGIKSNKTIKKLKIRQFTRDNTLNENSFYVSEFFEIIKQNTTLSSIGLEFFGIDICNSYLLSPLIEMKNINTLSCGSYSLELYFNHCNENSNIKKLVIYQQGNEEDEDERFKIIIKQFKIFIKNNNSSLEIIKFVYYRSFPDQTMPNKLNNLLITNNYNNNEKGSKNLKLIHNWGEYYKK